MAKLKYEFLAHYYQAHGFPLRNRLFSRIESWNRLGARVAPLANWFASLSLSRWLLERMAGIDARRPLPKLAAETFEDWFERHPMENGGEKREVVLFHDTFNNFNTPSVAIAATEFLRQAGYQVSLAQKKCCGRPMISKGMLQQAKENAAWNVSQLAPFVNRGVAVVGLEPSCLLTLRDEYPELLRSETAKLVAENSFLFEEFVVREQEKGRMATQSAECGRKALLHGHCHQKALAGTAATMTVLRQAGCAVTEVDSGCCGMAGSFGFEKEHYDLSLVIGNRRLAPAVMAAGADVEIVAPGISCRQQIEHLTGRKAKHPAEVLWEQVTAGSRR
jgi:Fe-S oxidoreductase